MEFLVHGLLSNNEEKIIHIANKNFEKTAGCIALKKIDLRKLIKVIGKDVKIAIN